MHKKLFIPGPTEVREDVLISQAAPMIGHRMKSFSDLYGSINDKFHKLFKTEHEIYVHTSSGTGLMEAASRNFINKKALHTVCGAFSKRWADISKSNGKEIGVIEVDMGKAIKPEMIDRELSKGEYDTLMVTQNETSTGVKNPVKEIGELLKEKYPDVLLLVDSVSSFMGMEIGFETWGVDVVVASSQKAFALPPGIAIMTISKRSFERAKEVKNRGFYFDVLKMKKYFDEKPYQTLSTPAISLFYALDYQLSRILNEGLDERYRRHKEMAGFVREWAKRYFALFAEQGYESDTVTAIKNTRGVSIKDLNNELGNRGMALSNGYGALKEKTFRIAHMGDITLGEIKDLIANINEIINLGV